ncbi:MAG: COX15/CtaA family protein [Candidatus Marinimicrobia bacterium]|nr:COX15/CtaA family protein [Candidatus Neomarinimicrobiota bacterium]
MNLKTQKQITTWLISACLFIFLMVIIGGVTRLTRSGLSMVEWHPISGILPPLTDTAWETEFEKYKQYPEYQKLNQNMTLPQFKFIFFWEFVHRLIGRLLGIFFIIPFAYFLIMKKLNPPLMKKLLFMFVLGGLQGLYGWYMVQSGLIDNPHVSHYRLAGHLILAFGLMAYIFWTALTINRERFTPSTAYNKEKLSPVLNWIIAAILLQIIYGAFTAGLKAGYGWNTFPKMAGEWVPRGLLPLTPFWKNFVEHNFTVQFIHRMLGWILCMLIPGFWRFCKGFMLTPQQEKAVDWLLWAILIQFGLGVITLIMVVPVWLGVMHQAGAVVLLMTAVYNRFLLNNGACQL